MLKGPRWNTHAVIAFTALFRVRSNLEVDVERLNGALRTLFFVKTTIHITPF